MKNLVIVESPAKAKTIEKYLGKDFTVLSSIGHIRSIPKKTSNGKPPIDVKNDFKTTYEVDPEKTKTVSELKKAVKSATTVWLATDEDREGEAIAWHLCEVLGLSPSKVKRIVFHEITKDAIEEAVKNPRSIDMNLVQAQQARQILDRIVGFELSPVLWQKVPGGKSAGRVQSPAVRLLVEREKEIEAFEGKAEFKITAEFSHAKHKINAELNKRFATEKQAHDFLKSLIGQEFSVKDVSKTPGTRNPGPPFTTSTLQQEANRSLGFSAKATMASAQKLYQAGKITYMRTDSVNLSSQALGQMTKYIQETFGKDYHQIRTFATKSANAQEAHEAIRPTHVKTEKASTNAYDQKLYSLIRNRTLASQMTPAKVEKTVITISIGKEANLVFEAKGEIILFDGFLKVYGNKKDDLKLPDLKIADLLKLEKALAKQAFERGPARYTEGSLVKKLEELGIGRPSTYATIITTVQNRGYAVRGESEGVDREVVSLILDMSKSKKDIVKQIDSEKTGSNKGKLVPTAVGEVVSNFLIDHFDPVIDYAFTAAVEEEFDHVAKGKLERNKMLDKFYQPFHKLVEQSSKISRSEVTKARKVGVDPKTKKSIYARLGRFGPMLQLGETSEEKGDEKPKFAPMPEGKKIETVTLDEALFAFQLPREVGQTEDGQPIMANVGRFGPYIQIGKLFVSIKQLDPHTIKLDEALELYKEKLKFEAEKNITDFGNDIKVLNGRFGPYVTDGKKNAKIEKDTDPKSITLEKAQKILAAAPDKPKRFRKK